MDTAWLEEITLQEMYMQTVVMLNSGMFHLLEALILDSYKDHTVYLQFQKIWWFSLRGTNLVTTV